jgi:hypothetical protein
MLSSAYHPQTDGQTERANQTLEVYLRCFVAAEQDDWADLLPFVEMALNNALIESTGTSPYYANVGFHPRFGVEPGLAELVPATKQLAQHLADVRTNLAAKVDKAKEQYARFADRRRRQGPTIKVGDMVLLNLRNVRTHAPSHKLGPLSSEPLRVTRVKDSAVELALPPEMGRLHPCRWCNRGVASGPSSFQLACACRAFPRLKSSRAGRSR